MRDKPHGALVLLSVMSDNFDTNGQHAYWVTVESIETIPSSAMYSTSGFARRRLRVLSENLPVIPSIQVSFWFHTIRQKSLTSKTVEDLLLPFVVSDGVGTELLAEPGKVVALGHIILELDDVGALLNLALELLDINERSGGCADDRSCQQGKSCSDQGEEAHCDENKGQ